MPTKNLPVKSSHSLAGIPHTALDSFANGAKESGIFVNLHAMNAMIAIDQVPYLAGSNALQRVCTVIAMSMSSQNPSSPKVCSEDSQAIAATLEGDPEAYGQLVERYQAVIAQQMRRFSRQPAVVEELVHDVFVEAFVSLKSFRSTAPLLHWLRKIAVRTGYRYWQRAARERAVAVPMSEIARDIELQINGNPKSPNAASELLGDLLDQLAPRDRLVLTLLYWDGCSIAEAADLSGWTQTMVKVQAFRARKRLKKLIEEAEA